MTTVIIVVAILIVINALFVAAEFAIISAPRATLIRMASGGSVKATRLLHIIDDPIARDRFIATAQLGITIASLGLGMYGEHSLAEFFEHRLHGSAIEPWVAASTLASVLAIGLLTYLHVVVGEMVPKSFALQYASRTALVVATPMRFFGRLMYPLVVLLNGMGNGILRMLGIEPQGAGVVHTVEEFQYVVRESMKGGALDETGAVLEELLEFSELTAGEVMVPRVRVTGIELGSTPDQLRELIARATHTRYPVFENDLDHIVGVVHIKDVLRALLRDIPLDRTYVHEPRFVPETAGLDQVLKAIIGARTQMILVMDEHGGTAGILTLDDLIEEIVGEVDESIVRRPPMAVDGIGRLVVAGTVRLEELGEELGLDLDHEEIDTVSGIILSILGRPVRVGDVVEYRGLELQVRKARGRGVEECVVIPKKESQPE
ncbi:MAG: hemolysin family protein [Acidobacteria bacterium]|nr:hemolysin family protein [Acidobacteriota bacterium]